ncbi:uncharacterized protein LOC127868388 isoform X2 [Dreissena polymorpha]|uniref:uncharacterized protein LOC127868388 isoform X2 n=1 Tax=Dreissena polymorpha TaxID=45954 RepID=UPI0022644BE3|nr:uncharacterized protein LOC127868388 isoform X2 [Dreissena polymorpha]XP_052266090.1 uncharacterized protein LOC127868388 isoform X2 [Dreissena polymorpha]
MVGRGGGRSQLAGRGRGRGSRGKARVGQTETGAVEGLNRPDQQQILMRKADSIHQEASNLRLGVAAANAGICHLLLSLFAVGKEYASLSPRNSTP